MDLEDPDLTYDALSAWPAFVDLLAATSLLLLALLAVILVWAGSGSDDAEGRILLQKQTLAQALQRAGMASDGDSLFTVDTTSDLLFVRVTLLADATFESNQWQWDALKSDGRAALESIGAVIIDPAFDTLYREVRVVGHTDHKAALGKNPIFSNWEFSAARASAVTRFLVEEVGVNPCKISATGYGPYRPLVQPVGSDTLSAAKNRRIELEFIPTAQGTDASSVGGSDVSCFRQGDGTSRESRAGAAPAAFNRGVR